MTRRQRRDAELVTWGTSAATAAAICWSIAHRNLWNL
jgi:hypothetical protein